MHRTKPNDTRNKIDLADPSQVRGLKKRLGISADDLQHAVGKVGNSIAAVSKELQKATPVTNSAPVQTANSIQTANSTQIWSDRGSLLSFDAHQTILKKSEQL